ncbi:saccharopine dehydrogenase NADP-binding domain-containing protein [Nannocystaceae bacterium ST9]
MATIRNPRKAAPRTLLLGAAGGVGSATLALLDRHALGRRLLEGTRELLLLDRDPPSQGLPARVAEKARWLPARAIESADDLAELLREHPVDEVIELAALGTWDCVEVCAEHGVSYLNTCYDHWDAAGPAQPSMVRARELFDPPDVEAGVHLIGAGMNPGLVNLLVGEGLRALAQRTGRPASLTGLGVHAIAFTELDTTREPARVGVDEFAATWCPEHCLEELLEPEAMIVVDGELVGLGHAPHRARYSARCGDQTIVGHMVPHEELVTLAAMYPGIELGYVYALPDAAMHALAAHPERRASEWPVRRLYPPETSALIGFDRIGALICSREHGELWIGWHTAVEDALALATNATLLQVATGLLAGWTSLRTREPGVWLAEELDGPRVLGLACSVLGELEQVWDPDAKPLGLRERRVD